MSFPPVSALLPHDPPMILVDELVAFDEGGVVVQARIRDGQPWVRDGRVAATFCLEYMAQAIACYAGMRSLGRGHEVRIGFLLGTRELTLEAEYLYVGDQLIISARHVFGDETLGSFACELSRGGDRVACATINVFSGTLDEGMP